MILAFDSYYFGIHARTVCLCFEGWTDARETAVFSELRENPEPYEPGAFYKRELPCILSLLQKIPVQAVEAILIDGFVFLDDAGKPGLGAHLHQSLQQAVPVIGVAKTRFAGLHQNQREVSRGGSIRPLYVTAIGIDLDLAAQNIQGMAGENRIPLLLKKLDGLTRAQTAGEAGGLS